MEALEGPHPPSLLVPRTLLCQVTRNPWDPSRAPGGSSGGSAAAVAARQVPVALGSDTGGSIRQPAHFCGVVGIKPTYGAVSRRGLIAYGSSLDCVGPLAGCVEDAALVLDVIAGADVGDATASPGGRALTAAGLLPVAALGDRPLAGVRAAVIAETMGPGLAPGVRAAVDAAVEHVRGLGAEVSSVSLPSFAAGLPAYYVIATSEASSNLARYDGVQCGVAVEATPGGDVRALVCGTRGAGLGAEVKRRILMGTYALSAGYVDAYYARAQRVRTLIRRELAAALAGVDVLLAPAAPTAAFPLGSSAADPLAMYLGDVMTVNLNLAGLPGVCVPCGFDAGGAAPLPVGLQVVAGPGRDADAVRVAHIFEQTAAGFASGVPPLAAAM